MSVATVHPQPWTVDELYALPEDGMRHELLDGTLLVSPPPSVSHQLGAARLRSLLAAAAPADVEVLEAVGVAVPAGLLVPDAVVARAAAVYAGPRQLQAGDVLAVAEIVSASSKTADVGGSRKRTPRRVSRCTCGWNWTRRPARRSSSTGWSAMPTGWKRRSAATRQRR